MLCSVWNIEEKLNLGGQMFNLKQYIILYKFTMNEAWSALTIPFIFTHIKKSIGPLDELREFTSTKENGAQKNCPFQKFL